MNVERLLTLADNSDAYAKAYTSITESLMREGVPEEEARMQAMQAALMAAWYENPADDNEPWEP